MMIKIGPSLNLSRLEATQSKLIAGSGSLKVDVYVGVQPEQPGGSHTSDLCATVQINKANTVIDSGVLKLFPSDVGMVQVTGTPTWSRVTNGEGHLMFDCSVGVAGSGADLTLSTAVVYAGANLGLQNFELT